MTRSSTNWKANQPGGWDVLNSRLLFPSSNIFDIPDMRVFRADAPSALAPFNLPARTPALGQACHFFLDDYRFERVWNRPTVYLNKLKAYDAVFTPDFSLYTDWPHACNLWNTYRNRWIGCFWQSHGLQVVPTIGWAGAESFKYCFLGVPQHSAVAIATPDFRLPGVLSRFLTGLDHMIFSLRPSLIFVYGSLPAHIVNSYPERRFHFYGGYGERFNAKSQPEKDGRIVLPQVQA